jgi:hypothetical protein
MKLIARSDGRLVTYATRLQQGAATFQSTAARELNTAGAAIRTQTIEAETDQTGLSKRTITRAQQATRASAGNLTYVIRAGGGNVRLKFFKARETLPGVSAAPWNRRQVFAGTFIKGGRFPKRVGLGMGGHVFQRTSGDRLPITGGRSGLYIGRELVTGQTAATFERASMTVIGGIAVRVAARILP